MEIFLVLGYYAASKETLDADDTLYYSTFINETHELTPNEEVSALNPLWIVVGGVRCSSVFRDRHGDARVGLLLACSEIPKRQGG